MTINIILLYKEISPWLLDHTVLMSWFLVLAIKHVQIIFVSWLVLGFVHAWIVGSSQKKIGSGSECAHMTCLHVGHNSGRLSALCWTCGLLHHIITVLCSSCFIRIFGQSTPFIRPSYLNRVPPLPLVRFWLNDALAGFWKDSSVVPWSSGWLINVHLIQFRSFGQTFMTAPGCCHRLCTWSAHTSLSVLLPHQAYSTVGVLLWYDALTVTAMCSSCVAVPVHLSLCNTSLCLFLLHFFFFNLELHFEVWAVAPSFRLPLNILRLSSFWSPCTTSVNGFLHQACGLHFLLRLCLRVTPY